MCGKSTALSRFPPGDDIRDVTLQSFTGLGQGRGFKVTGTESALGDQDLCRGLAHRAAGLLRLLVESGTIDPSEIGGELPRSRSGAGDDEYREFELEDAEERLTTARGDLGALTGAAGALVEALEELFPLVEYVGFEDEGVGRAVEAARERLDELKEIL
jgi:hypothetical protein